LPIGVGRTVELGRTVSDAEWDRLVVLLRETFDARGVIKNEGSFRSWNNGNLQILLEPGASGHRLRMSTFNQGAQSWMVGGVAMVAFAIIMVLTGIFTGTLASNGFGNSGSLVAAIGAAVFAVGALRLPRWARTRQDQMNEIAELMESQSLVMMNSGAPSNS